MSAVVRTEECPRRSETTGSGTPSATRCDPWLWRRECRLAPLGRPSLRNNSETTDETEFGDRKSTRLNSSHRCISYAVFRLKKKIFQTLGGRCPSRAVAFNPAAASPAAHPAQREIPPLLAVRHPRPTR